MSLGGLALQHTVDGGLTRQLLEHLGGTGESVTRLADGNVQNELLNLQLPHGIVVLLGGHGCGVLSMDCRRKLLNLSLNGGKLGVEQMGGEICEA
jgi:hypothetical protein